MRLGYFTMPLHPPHRDPLKTLGFNDTFVGEHLTDRCENVTGSYSEALGILSEYRNRIFAEAIGESIRPREVAERT